MKKLINAGKRKFVCRKDRDYIQDLLDIGISEEEAWVEVLTLSKYNYVHDYKSFSSKIGNDALVFKKDINGYLVYIKLKIEQYNNNDFTICLSFHIDHK